MSKIENIPYTERHKWEPLMSGSYVAAMDEQIAYLTSKGVPPESITLTLIPDDDRPGHCAWSIQFWEP